MRISVCYLTMNCVDTVQAIQQDKSNAGRNYDQWIWVDQGSTDGTQEIAKQSNPDVLILNEKNTGSSRGTNQGWYSATGDWIVAANHSCVCPPGWLKSMEQVAQTGQVDAICIYDEPYPSDPGRHMPGGCEKTHIGGHEVYPTMPFARMMFNRNLLDRVGYLREDLGMYGWNDVEWGYRCRSFGIRSYAFVNIIKTRLQSGAKTISINGEMMDYRKWRDKEVSDPKKQEVMGWCSANNFPYYNPFK